MKDVKNNRIFNAKTIGYMIMAAVIIILTCGTTSSEAETTFSGDFAQLEETTTTTTVATKVVTIYLDFSEYNTTTTASETTTTTDEVTTEATTEVTTEVTTDVTTETSSTTDIPVTTTTVFIAPATNNTWTWEDYEDEYSWEDNYSWEDDSSNWYEEDDEEDYSWQNDYSWEDNSSSWEDNSWQDNQWQTPPSWGYSVTLYTYAGGGNSWENIKLACDAINGIYVPAYGDFSWMRDVGMCNSWPYLPAGVYIGNQKATGIGGGICFPSTTLMQAAESAGMWITEKHPHTLEVIYNPRPDPDVVGWAAYEAALSREAAIDTDCGVDMKFTNPTGTGYTIYASCDQWSGSCTMTLVPD